MQTWGFFQPCLFPSEKISLFLFFWRPWWGNPGPKALFKMVMLFKNVFCQPVPCSVWVNDYLHGPQKGRSSRAGIVLNRFKSSGRGGIASRTNARPPKISLPRLCCIQPPQNPKLISSLLPCRAASPPSLLPCSTQCVWEQFWVCFLPVHSGSRKCQEICLSYLLGYLLSLTKQSVGALNWHSLV